MQPIEATSGGVRLRIKVVPRSSRTQVVGVHGDMLRIRLAAVPADGAANDALLSFLITQLDVPRARVRLLSGQTSRLKVVEIAGVDPAWVATRLDAHPLDGWR